jgi:hypothetical protein
LGVRNQFLERTMAETTKRILDGYLTQDEAVEEFGKKKQTLRRWRRQRIGPPWVDSPLGPLYPIAEGRDYLRRNLVQTRTKTA